jgi:AbrB family looped-hinge helix DNA binding protein
MATFGTTRMSSKGQVVIPEDVRNRLGLSEGVEFVVIGENDAIVLKAISAPPMSDFNKLLKTARAEARQAKMKRADVTKSVRRVRRNK